MAMSIFSELGIQTGKDRKKEEVLYNIASCYALFEQRMSRILRPYHLSPVKMNALMMVKHVGVGNGLSQIEIGKRMIVSAGNITRLVDRMEQEGLVERLAQPKDRRVKRIKITKKGSDLLDQVWSIYIKEIHQVTSSLSDQDSTELVTVLGRLRKSISA
ncbi:MAG: MarR family transcriptional regulator [Candidatus Omnitrophota bacterium]